MVSKGEEEIIILEREGVGKKKKKTRQWEEKEEAEGPDRDSSGINRAQTD